MAATYITSQELIKTLKISSDDLIEIQEFFDAIPDDEWELCEGKDYKIVNKTTGLREYTQSGAYTIARYLEATKKLNFWQQITEWFLHTKREIRRNFLKKKILDNSSSLMKRNNLFFVSKADTIAIFGTRSDYLHKMDEHANRSQFPLIKGQDYDEFIDAGGLHYSISGIYKLSQAFGECHSKKNRREECKEIGEVVKPQIEDIVKEIIRREKQIQVAMKSVKDTRDKRTCQVTLQKHNSVNQLKLASHHLYSQNEYPFLAANTSNLITITCEVHDQFHQHYMSGSSKPCTIDDFIGFVQRYYPHNTQVVIWLESQKLILGNPQPVDKRKPHVLYLPASKVS